jgi:predicted nucleic acid-binding protein
MAFHFLDTSTFVRAYMPDEDGHDEALAILISGRRFVASELLRVEAARAVRSAERAGRVSSDDAMELLTLMEADIAEYELIDFDGPATLSRARELVLDHPIRTLDALHLAVADHEGRRLVEPDEELVFVSHDERQRDVARALGLAVL